MARIRSGSEWFPEISSQALYETEFEAVFLQNSEMLRRNAVVVPFKQTVYSGPFDSARADLALIDGDYREWWVIELELIHHDLTGHVLPQVRTLADGHYGPAHAEALCRSGKLNPDRVASMIRGEPPRVLVISNRFRENWAKELKAIGVYYLSFSIFRSDLDKDIFLLDGELPSPRAEVVTRLTPAAGIPRFLRVHSPATLPSNKSLTLTYDGKQSEWLRMDTADQCFITSAGRMPVHVDRPFVIKRAEDGTLTLSEDLGERT